MEGSLDGEAQGPPARRGGSGLYPGPIQTGPGACGRQAYQGEAATNTSRTRRQALRPAAPMPSEADRTDDKT